MVGMAKTPIPGLSSIVALERSLLAVGGGPISSYIGRSSASTGDQTGWMDRSFLSARVTVRRL